MPATTLPGIDIAAVRNVPGVTIGGTGPPRAPTTCTRPSAHAATASCVLPSASATTAPPHAMATDSARPDCQRRTRPSEPRVTTWRSASAKAANVTGPAGPSVESCRDDRTSQMRVTPSSPPATSHRPSRLKLTCSTRVVPPTSVARRLASEALQTWVFRHSSRSRTPRPSGSARRSRVGPRTDAARARHHSARSGQPVPCRGRRADGAGRSDLVACHRRWPARPSPARWNVCRAMTPGPAALGSRAMTCDAPSASRRLSSTR